MDPVIIKETKQTIHVENSCVDGSDFTCASVKNLRFEDVNLSGTKISNANMSDMEIDGAQLGGAYIHNIGMPPKDHPFYVAGARQRPLRFEDCDLNNSSFTNCDFTGVAINTCKFEGMTIEGIPVEKLLSVYKDTQQ